MPCLPLDVLHGLLFRVMFNYHASTATSGWRSQNETSRKVKMNGGSLICTVQVRKPPAYLSSVVERHIDAPTATLAQIRQWYRRHTPLCDGEKFLHIRFNEREKTYAVASRWTKLLGAKAKSLRQVLRSEWLRDCLERLEPFRALWTSFQLGSFPLILSWRCRQVRLLKSKAHRVIYSSRRSSTISARCTRSGIRSQVTTLISVMSTLSISSGASHLSGVLATAR